MDRWHYDRTVARVAAVRRDLRALDVELATLALNLAGPLPRVSHDLLRKIEIAGDDLGYLADSLRMLHPMAAPVPAEASGLLAEGYVH